METTTSTEATTTPDAAKALSEAIDANVCSVRYEQQATDSQLKAKLAEIARHATELAAQIDQGLHIDTAWLRQPTLDVIALGERRQQLASSHLRLVQVATAAGVELPMNDRLFGDEAK